MDGRVGRERNIKWCRDEPRKFRLRHIKLSRLLHIKLCCDKVYTLNKARKFCLQHIKLCRLPHIKLRHDKVHTL